MKKILFVSLILYVLGFVIVVVGFTNYFWQSELEAYFITGVVVLALAYITNFVAFILGVKDVVNNKFTPWFYVSLVVLLSSTAYILLNIFNW